MHKGFEANRVNPLAFQIIGDPNRQTNPLCRITFIHLERRSQVTEVFDEPLLLRHGPAPLQDECKKHSALRNASERKVSSLRPRLPPHMILCRRGKDVAPRLPRLHEKMTRTSPINSDTPARVEIELIAEDIRRQREDLERLKRSSSASSAETAQIVAQIKMLRRRMEALTTNGDASC